MLFIKKLSNYLWLNSLKKHRSRMSIFEAPIYTVYSKECQKIFSKNNLKKDDTLQKKYTFKKDFEIDGVCSIQTAKTSSLAKSILNKIIKEEKETVIWSNNDSGRYIKGDIYCSFPEIEKLFREELSIFLEEIYNSYFKIFYGIIYKSSTKNRMLIPQGSQLWHSDSGPGTCINLMISLSELTKNNGAMEILPWKYSFEIFKEERAYMRKFEHIMKNPENDNYKNKLHYQKIRSEFYGRKISEEYSGCIVQPQGRNGTVIAMANNIIHKGGFPNINQSRYVCLFHIYPSNKPTPYKTYRASGIQKNGPYPKTP